ncbi:MAG TPA: thymidine phosphorylase, partial [Chloroflexi bacterium]|nr:thymidine phosphorylase [Chloroflexota bacterium]
MTAQEIIAKKRDGMPLSSEEIDFFIQGMMSGEIPDYQISAWLMAVYLRGMSSEETAHLTYAMAHSGRTLDVGRTMPMAVDKHSTGGVGDKTTLVVAPLVVAAGLAVAKISGRGLGFTGGTLDKLESFPGFTAELSAERFMENLSTYRIVVAGQTADLVPADGRLYALRDVTATVGSYPLIASSIMSKKLAVGARAIVFDVKVGRGAFMKTTKEARELATILTDLASSLDMRAVAVISDMNQPLGEAVGNALEVKEAIDTLSGAGPEDFVSHCLNVAGQMLLLTGQAQDEDAARGRLADLLRSGEALDKLRLLVKSQDGDPAPIDDPSLLPQAPVQRKVSSPRNGYISQLDAMAVGLTATALGAGRTKKGEPVDHAVGIVLHRKIGESVAKNDPLCTIHAQSEEAASEAEEALLGAYKWQEDPVQPPP